MSMIHDAEIAARQSNGRSEDEAEIRSLKLEIKNLKKKLMKREEAVKFFTLHEEWMRPQWEMTPEGRAYREKFSAAIEAIKP